MRLQSPSTVRFSAKPKTDINFARAMVERYLKDNKVNSFTKITADKTLGILIWTKDAADSEKTIQAMKSMPHRFKPTKNENEFTYSGFKVGVWVDQHLQELF